MTPATVFVSKPAKRARPWSSCTTMSPVRRSANERSAPRPRPALLRAAGAAAAEQPVLGDDGELKPGGDEAVAQAGLGEGEAGRRPAPFIQSDLQAGEVVGGALALAAVRKATTVR